MTVPVPDPSGDIQVHPVDPRAGMSGSTGFPELYRPQAAAPMGWDAPVGTWPTPGGDTHYHLHYHAAPTVAHLPAGLGNQPVVLHRYQPAPQWTPPAVALTFLIALATAVIVAWFSIQAMDWLISSFIHTVGG